MYPQADKYQIKIGLSLYTVDKEVANFIKSISDDINNKIIVCDRLKQGLITIRDRTEQRPEIVRYIDNLIDINEIRNMKVEINDK